MKRLFLLCLLTFALLNAVMAQVVQPIFDLVKDYLSVHYVTLAMFVPVVVLISGYANTWFKVESKWRQRVSWLIAFVLGFVGYYLQIGIFEGLSVLWTVIVSFGSGLVANGIYDLATVQSILEALQAKDKKVIK